MSLRALQFCLEVLLDLSQSINQSIQLGVGVNQSIKLGVGYSSRGVEVGVGVKVQEQFGPIMSYYDASPTTMTMADMQDIQISLTVDTLDTVDVPMTDRKKKGRGFAKENSYQKNEIVDYESLQDFSKEFHQKSIEGWILLATGVHEEASEEDLLDLFSDYGVVKNLHLNLDRRTGYVKGYALLEYSSIDEAKAAIAAEVVLLGKKLTVDFAFVRRPQPQ